MTSRRLPGLALALLSLTVPLAACGDESASSDSGATAGAGDDATLSVVTTTNVWGDIAGIVGGDAVEVASFLDDPSQDPHSYEANATNVLAVKKADLLVENGGGYDDWMEKLVDAADTEAPLVDAVEVSGKEAAAGAELNEHVWYDFPTAAAMADRLAEELAELDPDRAAEFRANADAFTDEIDALVAEEESDAADLAGRAIGITEPVPLYLTEALGLENFTPPDFSEAIEEGDDVPVSVLGETLDLYADGSVSALIYNEQTSGPVTEKIEQAAKANDVAVVPVTETLPEGMTYVEWMRSNLDAIVGALS